MKRIRLYLPLLALTLCVLTFSACKKKTTTDANDLTNTKDANGVSNTVDATSDDATAAAGQVIGMAGKRNSSGGYYMLCGSTVVDTGNGRQINITYDGTTVCNGVTRSGTITIALASGSPTWSTQGAVLNVTITNLKVTDVTTSNSFTLNGNHTITNETGGLAWEMFWNPQVGSMVKHRDKSSNMTVTFSDGSTGSWNVDRTRIWSVPSTGVVNFEVTSENTGNEDTWGTDRYGEQFTTDISSPIQADNTCSWVPYTGKYVYNVPSRSATASILFGTNSSGTQIGTATTCATGFYLTYTLSTYNYTYNQYFAW